MVGRTGIAPAISWSQTRRVTATLPPEKVVDRMGIAPTARCLQGTIATEEHAGPKVKWHGVSVLPRARQVLETRLHKLVPSVKIFLCCSRDFVFQGDPWEAFICLADDTVRRQPLRMAAPYHDTLPPDVWRRARSPRVPILGVAARRGVDGGPGQPCAEWTKRGDIPFPIGADAVANFLYRRTDRQQRTPAEKKWSPHKDLHPDHLLRTERCCLLHHAE